MNKEINQKVLKLLYEARDIIHHFAFAYGEVDLHRAVHMIHDATDELEMLEEDE